LCDLRTIPVLILSILVAVVAVCTRQMESPTCPHCGSGDETAEHLLLLCPKWAAERQRYFGDSIDIIDVFQDYESLVEFLISSGHLSPHIDSA